MHVGTGEFPLPSPAPLCQFLWHSVRSLLRDSSDSRCCTLWGFTSSGILHDGTPAHSTVHSEKQVVHTSHGAPSTVPYTAITQETSLPVKPCTAAPSTVPHTARIQAEVSGSTTFLPYTVPCTVPYTEGLPPPVRTFWIHNHPSLHGAVHGGAGASSPLKSALWQLHWLSGAVWTQRSFFQPAWASQTTYADFYLLDTKLGPPFLSSASWGLGSSRGLMHFPGKCDRTTLVRMHADLGIQKFKNRVRIVIA